MLSLNELMNLSCNLGTGRILFISFIVLLYNRGPMLEMLLSVTRNLLKLISKYCGILLSVCLSGDFSNILSRYLMVLLPYYKPCASKLHSF